MKKLIRIVCLALPTLFSTTEIIAQNDDAADATKQTYHLLSFDIKDPLLHNKIGLGYINRTVKRDLFLYAKYVGIGSGPSDFPGKAYETQATDLGKHYTLWSDQKNSGINLGFQYRFWANKNALKKAYLKQWWRRGPFTRFFHGPYVDFTLNFIDYYDDQAFSETVNVDNLYYPASLKGSYTDIGAGYVAGWSLWYNKKLSLEFFVGAGYGINIQNFELETDFKDPLLDGEYYPYKSSYIHLFTGLQITYRLN